MPQIDSPARAIARNVLVVVGVSADPLRHLPAAQADQLADHRRLPGDRAGRAGQFLPALHEAGAGDRARLPRPAARSRSGSGRCSSRRSSTRSATSPPTPRATSTTSRTTSTRTRRSTTSTTSTTSPRSSLTRRTSCRARPVTPPRCCATSASAWSARSSPA